MKKNILLMFTLIFVQVLMPIPAFAAITDNPEINSQPVISWGNSSYHDSLGARDPFVVKDQSTYYLYYDCIEDLLNPSFESNLGTNGWDTYEAQISSSTDEHLFGQQSLKVITSNKGSSGLLFGAFTGNYYYQNIKDETHLAVPTGLEVTPNTAYIASVYVKAPISSYVGLTVTEYTDDPGFWNNHIEPISNKVAVGGNNNWQRLVVKFTTLPSTKAITISLVANGNTTTYWDGIQLERVIGNVTDPSSFPTDQSYNQKLEDIIGWRSCLATSGDGVNFTKKGQISITGTRGTFETVEIPGWVGSSGMYISPFFYQGYWYSYTWVAGYQLGTAVYTTDLVDNQSHRKWYGDRRAFLPNGNPTRSGLVRSTSLLGPFERVSQNGPQVSPNPSTGWGQTYVSANGVPQIINGQWVLFLAGAVGSTWNTTSWTTITPGIATGDSPLGPWTVTNYSPLLPPNNQNEIPEGPIYYHDRSGTDFLFLNDIRASSAVVHWTTNPLASWIPENKKTIIGNQVPWLPSGSLIGLSTVVEENEKNLLIYFAARSSTDRNNWNQYLFHDIGRATLSLPLFPLISTPTPIPTAIPTNTPTPIPTTIPKPGDLDGDGDVDSADFNKMVAEFGHHYTIFDYNILVGNFGK